MPDGRFNFEIFLPMTKNFATTFFEYLNSTLLYYSIYCLFSYSHVCTLVISYIANDENITKLPRTFVVASKRVKLNGNSLKRTGVTKQTQNSMNVT